MSRLIKRGVSTKDDPMATELGFRRADSPDARSRGLYRRRAA